MNEDRIIRFLNEIGLDPSDGFHRKAYASNAEPDRSIYIAGDRAIVKVYGKSALGAYTLERDLSLILHNQGAWSPQIIGYRSHDDEAYLAICFIPGLVLNDVYQEMPLAAYCDMLRKLGQAMQSFHTIGLDKLREVQFMGGVFLNHLTKAVQRWVGYSGTLQDALVSGLINEMDGDNISAHLEAAAPRRFTSKVVLSHTDIHNENLILCDGETGPPLAIIDWETAAIQPRELDFVHPFLNIFGEGFRWRRLGVPGTGVADAFIKAFEAGYGEQVDWDLVAAHSLLWYLESAMEAQEKGKERAKEFYLKTGLGALDFVA